jgi:hypothetical protein
MAKKKVSKQIKEIVPFQAAALTTAAAQLKVTLEVDSELLRQEVDQYTKGFDVARLAIETIEVSDNVTFQQCVNWRNDCGDRIKGLTEIWDRYKDPLNRARAVVLGFEHDTVDPISDAKDLATQKCEQYVVEQKQAKRKAEEALAAAAKKEQAKLESKADGLMAMGYIGEAEKLMAQATMCVAPELPSAIPYADGARVGDKFTGRVTDTLAVLKAIVDGERELMWEVKPGDVRPLVVIDSVVLNAMVGRHGLALDFPGIVVEEGARISAKRLCP